MRSWLMREQQARSSTAKSNSSISLRRRHELSVFMNVKRQIQTSANREQQSINYKGQQRKKPQKSQKKKNRKPQRTKKHKRKPRTHETGRTWWTSMMRQGIHRWGEDNETQVLTEGGKHKRHFKIKHLLTNNSDAAVSHFRPECWMLDFSSSASPNEEGKRPSVSPSTTLLFFFSSISTSWRLCPPAVLLIH